MKLAFGPMNGSNRYIWSALYAFLLLRWLNLSLNHPIICWSLCRTEVAEMESKIQAAVTKIEWDWVDSFKVVRNCATSPESPVEGPLSLQAHPKELSIPLLARPLLGGEVMGLPTTVAQHLLT